jgi:CRISPR system Cascade subunit CasE
MKYLVKVPLHKLHGPYLAHKVVYEAVGGGRPVWRRYADHVIVMADSPSDLHPSKAYDPSPSVGQRLRIDLLTELSKADGKPLDGGRSPRIDPVLQAWIASGHKASWQELGLEHGTAWLEKRQTTHGFEIEQIDIADYATLEFIREGNPIRMGTMAYSAIVKVTDDLKFRSAMLNGIGRGKAWGLGLLLCKRIQLS